MRDLVQRIETLRGEKRPDVHLEQVSWPPKQGPEPKMLCPNGFDPSILGFEKDRTISRRNHQSKSSKISLRIKSMVRPERLLRGLRPLVLRFAPDRRRA